MAAIGSLITKLSDITVPFAILHDRFSAGADKQGAWAQVTFLVAYTNMWTFMENVAGLPVNYGSGNANLVVKIPLQFWDNVALYADSISSKGLGTNAYATGAHCEEYIQEYAEVTVHFRSPIYDYTNQELVTVQTRYAANFLTLPKTAYTFQSDGAATDTDVGRLMSQVEFSVTLHRVVYFDAAAVQGLVGNVNSGAYALPDGSVAAAGTLLFNGCNTTYNVSMLGTPLMTAEYSFVYRPVEWNKFMRPDGTSFDYLQDGGGNLVYPQGNFASLGL